MGNLNLIPRMSEKAYISSQNLNTYVFVVPLTANKAMVANEVAAEFKVTVEDVRLALIKGKVKKSYRKRSRPVAGKRTDYKKAYVRIKDGDKIEIFGKMEEDTKAEEKAQEIVSKASQKAAESETKKKGVIGRTFGRGQRQVQNKGGDK